MTEITARIADLINFSSNQKPVEFADAFKNLVQDKVAAAIENRKVEIAKSMFAGSQVEDEEEQQEVETDSEETETEEQTDG